MKRAFCLALAALFVVGVPSVALAGEYSIGGFAGLNIPVAQEDASSGALFGIKGRIMLLPFLGLEPNFTYAKYGGKDVEVREQTYNREGGEITSFGADLLLGSLSGMGNTKFYGLVGVNSNNYTREGISDESGLGFALGTGLEFFPAEMISLEIRGKYHPINLGEGGRVHVEISGGLNYYFGGE
jgi:opacity protein-like surface antigen